MAAPARQRDGDCASDSAGRSGDDGSAALEIQHDRGFSRFKKSVIQQRPGSRAIAGCAYGGPETADFTRHSPATLRAKQFDAQLEAFVDCNKMDYSQREPHLTAEQTAWKHFVIFLTKSLLKAAFNATTTCCSQSARLT
jgi:hypothetical protein